MTRKKSPEATGEATPKKKKKVARRKKPAAETVPVSWKDRLLSAMFRPKVLLWVGLAGAAFVIGPAVAQFLPDLSQRDEYRIATSQIQIPDPPRWVPTTLLDQIIELSLIHI